jgi:cell surface protein SprA
MNRNDPQPDGVFDYVEGYTVISKMGRIVFPLFEPFGKDLQEIAFKGIDTNITKKYIIRNYIETSKQKHKLMPT